MDLVNSTWEWFEMAMQTSAIHFASVASVLLTVGCIPERRPISRPPLSEPTAAPEKNGEPSTQGGTQHIIPPTILPPVTSTSEATTLAAQCGPEGGDQAVCVRLGRYWQAQSDKPQAFTYFSRACKQVVKQGLQVADENSGCSDAMTLAPAEQALEYKLITCGIYTLNPICVDLCRMEIAIPNEATSATTTLPSWWSSAEPKGGTTLTAKDLEAGCFASTSPWFGDATTRATAQRNAALCLGAPSDPAACRAAATAFQESLSSLSDAARTAARRCSAVMHDLACMASREIAISKAPFTTQSCAVAASKYEQLFAAKAVPQSDQRRAAALYCRAGIVAVGTILRSSAGSGIAARCVDVAAAPTSADNLPYVAGCRQVDAFKAKAFGTP
jgi:hypothetical protein